MTVADLRHVDAWVFDLDHTLYPPGSAFMDDMVRVLTDYVAKVSGLPRDEAFALQSRYIAEHGLCLLGLMQDYGVAPAEYQGLFHDMPMTGLAPDPELRAALARLPGRRFVFTVSDEKYARRVMRQVGIEDLFDDVFSIDSSGYVTKPTPVAYDRLVAKHLMAPQATAFFDDVLANLAPAAAMGMTTVLVRPDAARSTAPFVHHRTDKLAAFLDAALVKEAA